MSCLRRCDDDTGSNNLLGPCTGVFPNEKMTKKVGDSGKPFNFLMCISPTLTFSLSKTPFSDLAPFVSALKSDFFFSQKMMSLSGFSGSKIGFSGPKRLVDPLIIIRGEGHGAMLVKCSIFGSWEWFVITLGSFEIATLFCWLN